MPSAAADSDLANDMMRARLRAGEMLAARGVYGLVWLDATLTVRNRYGSIADFIGVGAPVAQSVPALVGLEADIKALTAAPDDVLRLTDVAIIAASGVGPRLNMFFYGFGEGHYMMVLSNADASSDIKINLDRQVRARLMAEAAALAQSRELARANAELQTANGNLEQFAEIITHDLKAPMRALNHMADAVEAALDAHDEAAARHKLGELRLQATRMSSMLSALLQYASSGLPGGAIDTVDTAALIGEIVRSLPHDGIEMQIGGVWPTIATFPAPLDLALRNLIQNSIKHHDRETGYVRVQCADAGPMLEITIADNGPGIAPEHHECIFMPFRTLGGSGGGMGLAIVQRTVKAVGGEIVVAANLPPGRGTIFTIRWPKSHCD